MTAQTNAFGSYQAIGNREDLSDIIKNISPTRTPLGPMEIVWVKADKGARSKNKLNNSILIIQNRSPGKGRIYGEMSK